MKSPERAALLGSAGVKSLPYFSHETAGHIHFLRPPDAHFSMEYAVLQKYIDFSFDGDGTPLPPRWKQFKTKREKAERTKAFQDAAMKILPYHIAMSTDKPGESTAKGPLTTERGWHNLACYLFCYCAAIVHNPPCPTKILIGLSRPTAAALTPTTDDWQIRHLLLLLLLRCLLRWGCLIRRGCLIRGCLILCRLWPGCRIYILRCLLWRGCLLICKKGNAINKIL